MYLIQKLSRFPPAVGRLAGLFNDWFFVGYPEVAMLTYWSFATRPIGGEPSSRLARGTATTLGRPVDNRIEMRNLEGMP